MSDDTTPEATTPTSPTRRRRFLHGTRVDDTGHDAHVWLPFSTRAELRHHRERTVPHCPPETVWNITPTDQPPPPEPAEKWEDDPEEDE